jgi:hypothetical protein
MSSSAPLDGDATPSGNVIVRMFNWWNQAFLDPEGFTPEAFGQHYTGNAELTVNGQLRGTGLDALARHYRRLQQEFESIQMELPVIDGFCCGNRVFVQCVTRAVRDRVGGENRPLGSHRPQTRLRSRDCRLSCDPASQG